MDSYVFIVTADLTQGMKNRGIQPFVSKTVTISAVEYTILQVSQNALLTTDIFDGYVWYSATDARDIKDNEAF